jgi:hypothetical protein
MQYLPAKSGHRRTDLLDRRPVLHEHRMLESGPVSGVVAGIEAG